MVAAAVGYVVGDDGVNRLLSRDNDSNCNSGNENEVDNIDGSNEGSDSDDESQRQFDVKKKSVEALCKDMPEAMKQLLLEKNSKWDKLPIKSFNLLRKRGNRTTDKIWISDLKLEECKELVSLRNLLVSHYYTHLVQVM